MDIPSGEERKWPGEYTVADFVASRLPPGEKMRFAHNLDSATSGVLTVAKTREWAAQCVKLFSQRLAKKEYRALLSGHTTWDHHLVDAPIAKDPTSEFRMMVSPEGKSARTVMRVIERGWLRVNGAPVTKVRLEPVTGRRHQLRWVWCVVAICWWGGTEGWWCWAGCILCILGTLSWAMPRTRRTGTCTG
jgi:23S rRNA-/tRNA-specific pseudouridylate synthase